MTEVLQYNDGKVLHGEIDVVREFPLVLRVNDRELVTLVASPHDLRFLVAGFLRLQGFVTSTDDFLLLSVCNDYGIANVRIKGELPTELKPVLTSGCGTGVTFSLPQGRQPSAQRDSIAVGAVFELMRRLAQTADRYKSHGGLHSAAIGDVEGRLLLHAEDLGRHNTVDRLAGEALLKGISLEGTILATSGRVSTEMAAKAAQLGIAVVASRTSPTDMAVRICDESGITLIGYLRGAKLTAYTHSEYILFS